MVSPADILNARILVVDDLKANVLLLEGMLRVAGYRFRRVDDRPEPGLRTSPQEPLLPDPARSPNARHGPDSR